MNILLDIERNMSFNDIIAHSDIIGIFAFAIPFITIVTTIILLIILRNRPKRKGYKITAALFIIVPIVLGIASTISSLNSYIDMTHKCNDATKEAAGLVKTSAVVEVGKEYDAYYFIDNIENFPPYTSAYLTNTHENWYKYDIERKVITVTRTQEDASIAVLFMSGGSESYGEEKIVPVTIMEVR